MSLKRPNSDDSLPTHSKKVKSTQQQVLSVPLKSKRQSDKLMMETDQETSQDELSETDIDSSLTDIEPDSPVKIPSKDSMLEAKERLEEDGDRKELDDCDRVEMLQKVVLLMNEKEIAREIAMKKYILSSVSAPHDVCFVVENTPLYSYKNILAFSSPKFKKMFDQKSNLEYQFRDIGEPGKSGSLQVVPDKVVIDRYTIPDAKRYVFAEFLSQFIIKFNINIDLSLILDVLVLAHEYEVQDMIIALEKQITDVMTADYLPKCLEVAQLTKSEKLNDLLAKFVPNVTETNVIQLLIACHKYKPKSLKRRVMKKLKNLPYEVTKIAGWDLIDDKLKDEIIKFIQSPEVS